MSKLIKQRFREFLPVVVDVETAGVTPHTDALLELCAITLTLDNKNQWQQDRVYHQHIEPFKGANFCKESLDFLGLDPFHPFRFAQPEIKVLTELFALIKQQLKKHKCKRAVLVGHNAWFDLLFIKAATKRCNLNSPFHSFTSFDTATLSGLYFGETVLAKACKAAKIRFDVKEAHSAIYDAQKTAELFCTIVNGFDKMVPPPQGRDSR